MGYAIEWLREVDAWEAIEVLRSRHLRRQFGGWELELSSKLVGGMTFAGSYPT